LAGPVNDSFADRTAIVPDSLDFATATVVSRHTPTAFTLLRDRAKLQLGEWVLVMGAAGGLGSAGVQVAKHLGAKVIAAAGAAERVKVGLDLGADAGVNYRAQDLTMEALRITAGRGVDVVFENIGDPDLFPKAFAAMARRGRLVTAGGHGGGIVPLDVNRLYQNHLTIIGATGETPDDVTLSLNAAVEGRFKVVVDRIMPLSQAVQAHELIESRTGIGKIENADDYVASMGAVYEQSPDAMPETLYDVVVEKHGSVSVGRTPHAGCHPKGSVNRSFRGVSLKTARSSTWRSSRTGSSRCWNIAPASSRTGCRA
jgi:NAD(P)-dependent dehydrogenase (short-subunit alcohol dehydrogenase family)